jgi:hypothetical protein
MQTAHLGRIALQLEADGWDSAIPYKRLTALRYDTALWGAVRDTIPGERPGVSLAWMKLAEDGRHNNIPDVVLWPGKEIPADAVAAAGGILSALDYPIAAAALGDRYGGDGETYFGVPAQPDPGNGLRWIIYVGMPARGLPLYCGDGHWCGDTGLYPGVTFSG